MVDQPIRRFRVYDDGNRIDTNASGLPVRLETTVESLGKDHFRRKPERNFVSALNLPDVNRQAFPLHHGTFALLLGSHEPILAMLWPIFSERLCGYGTFSFNAVFRTLTNAGLKES